MGWDEKTGTRTAGKVGNAGHASTGGAPAALGPGKVSRTESLTNTGHASTGGAPAALGPGKVSRTESLVHDGDASLGDRVASSAVELPYKSELEQLFGERLADIRVHLGEPVAVRELGGIAAAEGNTIVFAETSPTKETVAHEVTHVLQARKGRSTATRGSAEAMAEAAEQRVAAGAPVGDVGTSAGGVHLKKEEGSDAPTSLDAKQFLKELFNIEVTLMHAFLLNRSQAITTHPYGAYVKNGESFLERMFGSGSPAHPLLEKVEQYVLPDSLVTLVDKARRLDDKNSSTGPAHPAYMDAVAFALANPMIRNVRQSLTRMIPRFVNAAQVQVSKDKVASGGTVPFPDELTPSHPVDRLVAYAMCRPGEWAIDAHKFAVDHPDQVAAGKNARTDKELEGFSLTFPTDRGLWHWVEVTPANATAEEVATLLFGAPEHAHRLIPMAPMFGFRSKDVGEFKPKYKAQLDEAAKTHPNAFVVNQDAINAYQERKAAKEKADHPYGVPNTDPMDGGVPVAAGVPMPEPEEAEPQKVLAYPLTDNTDPMRELATAKGEGFAAARAGALPSTHKGESHDEKQVYDRTQDALDNLNTVETAFASLQQPANVLAELRGSLLQRKRETEASCPQNVEGLWELTDRQVRLLGRLAKAANDAVAHTLLFGGVSKKADAVAPSPSDLPDASREPIEDAARMCAEAIGAMAFPEVAEGRVAQAESAVRLLRIAILENSVHETLPTVASAMDSQSDRKGNADYRGADLRTQGDSLLAELSIRRVQTESDPMAAEKGLGDTQSRAGDYLFEMSAITNLEALDQAWSAVDGQHDFWESMGNNLEGRGLQGENRNFYQQFKSILADYKKSVEDKNDTTKKDAKERFLKLVNGAGFGAHFKKVKDHLESEASQKKWTKIIVGIGIAVVAMAAGQWYFGAVLLEGGSMFAAVAGAGLVETTTNAVLSKLILDVDPTAGSLITGFLGSAGMYAFLGKTIMMGRAAGVAAEVGEGAKVVWTGKALNAIKSTGRELVIAEALGLMQAEVQTAIDQHRPMTDGEIREAFVHNIAGLIGMKIGARATEAVFDPMKPLKQYVSGHGVDIAQLMADQKALRELAAQVEKTKDPKLAQTLITQEKAFLERLNDAQQKMVEWAKLNPSKVSGAKLSNLEAMGQRTADAGVEASHALMSLEEVGPGLFRADTAAFDSIVQNHKQSGDHLIGVETDPMTGVRTLKLKSPSGETVRVKEKLANPKDRQAAPLPLEQAAAFEQWMQTQTLTMEPAMLERMRELYARDPAAAVKQAKHYGFEAQSLPGTEPAPPIAKNAAKAEPRDAAKAYETYQRENAASPRTQSAGNETPAMTRSDFEKMYQAGYEYDPIGKTWRLADGTETTMKTPAGTVGSGKPLEPSASHSQVLGDVHSQAVGEEVLHMLAAGDAAALRIIGIEPPRNFDSRANEWGLGRRKDNGTVVLVRGSHGEVDWSLLPDIEPLAHSHPIKDPVTGQSRALTGKNGQATINVANASALQGSATHADLVWFLPSTGDVRFVALGGKAHKVMTPFAHLGDGTVGNPTVGMPHETVDIQIVSAEPVGRIGDSVVYRAEIKVFAGEKPIGSYDMYQMFHNDLGELPQFTEPLGMTKLDPSSPLAKATKTPAASFNPIGHFEAPALAHLTALGVDLAPGSAGHVFLSKLSPHEAGIVSSMSEAALLGRMEGFDTWMTGATGKRAAGALIDLEAAQKALAADPALKIKVLPDGTVKYIDPAKPAAPVAQADPADLTVRVKATVAGEKAADFQWHWSDADTARVIAEGRKLGLSDDELHDQIRNAQRTNQPQKDGSVKVKAISPDEMIQQFKNYKTAEARRFPFGFDTLEDYQRFSAELKAAIAASGLPTDQVKLQGSAWRKEQPPDFDIAVLIDERAFNGELIKAFDGRVRAKDGTAVSLTLDNLGTTIDAINADPKAYNALASTLTFAYKNRTIRSQDVKGLSASKHLLEGKYKEMDLTIMTSSGYLNRHFSVLLP